MPRSPRSSPPAWPTGADDAELRLTLAHALRTPLTAITLGAGALQGDALGPLTATQREVVQTLTEQVERMRHALDELLCTDRLGAYAGPRPRIVVLLADVVRAAIAPLEPQAREARVVFTARLARGIRVEIDARQIAWSIASLLNDALSHAPSPGAIDVASSRRGPVARVRITDARPGRVAGASDDERRRIHRVREIADAHGGRLRIVAPRAPGARFVLELPSIAHEVAR